MKAIELLRGPASLSQNGATLLATDDVNAQFIYEFTETSGGAFGVVRKPFRDRRIEVGLSPLCFQDLAKLFPWQSTILMDSLMLPQLPLVITPRNGAPLTVVRSAVTKFPTVRYSTSGSQLGPLMFTGIVGIDEDGELLDFADNDSYYIFGAAATNVALAGYDGTKITNDRYTLAYGGNIYTPDEGGFLLEPELSVERHRGDNTPTVDIRFVSLKMRLRFVPINVAVVADDTTGEAVYANVAAGGIEIGDDAPLGDGVVAGSAAGKLQCTLKNAQLTDARLVYGKAARQGEMVLEAVRTVTTNVPDPLCVFGTVGA